MNKSGITTLVVLIVSSYTTLLFGGIKNSLGLKGMFLTVHVSDNTIQRGDEYKRKLSEDGRWLFSPGVEIYYERALAIPLIKADALRIGAGGWLDSMNHKSGYFGILSRWNFSINENWKFACGFGLALIFRETWNKIDWYKDNGEYIESDNFLPGYQYRFIPAGDLGLHYQLSDKLALVWTIFPGIPYVITHSAGMHFSF